MKTKVPRKVVLMCSAVLLGIAVCMSFWLFLQFKTAREHKTRNFLASNELVAERRNTWQTTKNTDENHKRSSNPDVRSETRQIGVIDPRHEHIILVEKVVQTVKKNFMSTLSEEELARPDIQKRMDAYDSLEFREMVKESLESGVPISRRKFWDVLESQGVPVDRGIYTQLFRKVFPTGEPEDYEPEMRLEMAKLFLAAEPVDLSDSIAAHRQRLKVYAQFTRQSNEKMAWLAGRFDTDSGGLTRRDGNPALKWGTDVQRNAESIVAAAEGAGDPGTDTDTSDSSWDMSSIMESSAASDREIEVSDTSASSARVRMPDAEIEAAIEKSLTPQPSDMPMNQPSNTPGEIQGNLENALKSQFSSERFDRAMDTLDRYGPEEGLRRLKENDPEVAKQVERHRNRNREEVSR